MNLGLDTVITADKDGNNVRLLADRARDEAFHITDKCPGVSFMLSVVEVPICLRPHHIHFVAEIAHLIAQRLTVPVKGVRGCTLGDGGAQGHDTEGDFALSTVGMTQGVVLIIHSVVVRTMVFEIWDGRCNGEEKKLYEAN